MPTFEYRPWKRIVVHEVLIFSLEEILKLAAMNTPMGSTAKPLRWYKGWVVGSEGFPSTSHVIREQIINDTVHWEFALFAPLKEYKAFLTTQEGKVTVPIIDSTDNEITKGLIDWFLETFKDKIKGIQK